MRVCLLFNPKAGSAGQLAALRRALSRRYRVTLVQTHDADDLTRKAVEAAAGRWGMVAVAGGDGTLHAVVNALGPNFPGPPLAFLPLGTGNDLCRTLGVPLDPVEAARKLRRHRARHIDVVRVEGGAANFLVNAATGGFSGRVAGEVTPELKLAWGPLAYLRGAAGPIAERASYRTTIRFDGGEPEEFDALNVVVANGRTAAGGVVVAPLANPEDGLLDVVIVRNADFLDLSVVTARLMAGDYLADENVVHRRAKRVEVTADPPMPFSVDGELTASARLTFEVLPKAVRVVPGKAYRPDPTQKPVAARPAQIAFAAVAEALWLMSRAVRWPGVGLTAAAVALLLFVLLARGVTAGTWDATNAAVRGRMAERSATGPGSVARAVTRLGDPAVTALVVAGMAGLFAWRGRYATAAGAVAVLVAVGGTELALKPYFALARPAEATTLGYGFPSGHALRGVGVFGFLAVAVLLRVPHSAWRWAAAAGLALLALAVPASRVSLGVHWLTDVLGGGLLGLAWAAVVAAAVWWRVRRAEEWRCPNG